MPNQDRLIQTFLSLVQIDSPSGEEAAVAKHVVELLKNLGGEVQFDSYGNVIGKFIGEGEPLLLNAHLDTVEPGRGIKPIVQDDRIVTDGTTVLGGDPKAGVAAILEALTSLMETKTKHVPLDVVFTLGEEVGLLGATNLDYSKLTAKQGVTFDGEEGVENITTSAPGYTRVDAAITGRSYHASQPEKGISAIQIAAHIISNLHIGKIDDETTANIGLIEGGSARNAVPEKVHFKAEIRSLNVQKLEKHTQHFDQVFNRIMQKYPQAKVQLDMHAEFDPYVFAEDHQMIERIKQVFQTMNIHPKLSPSLGGTDVNIFHQHGIEAICVGTGDYEAHTKREYVKISELVQTAKFCEKLITIGY